MDENNFTLAKLAAQGAVLKEIVTSQAVTLLAMDLKLNQLWDANQRDRGQREAERTSLSRWRWLVSTAIAILGVVLAYLLYSHS